MDGWRGDEVNDVEGYKHSGYDKGSAVCGPFAFSNGRGTLFASVADRSYSRIVGF